MSPATVKIPPTMAHVSVRKCVKGFLCSVYVMSMGEISSVKKTPESFGELFTITGQVSPREQRKKPTRHRHGTPKGGRCNFFMFSHRVLVR
jgi:hypothetical protein